MPIVEKRPLTPSQRFYIQNKHTGLDKKRPEKSLIEPLPKSGGRNVNGRITSRRRGGGHKRHYRIVDFRRDKFDIPATVVALEYDPNRSAHIALLQYEDGEKRYILAPDGLKKGDVLLSSQEKIEFKAGNNMPLRHMPPASRVHSIELTPNRKAQMARSAGTFAQLVGIEAGKAMLKLPSGEIRYVNADCRATYGIVGNTRHQNQQLGKAGRSRWMGKRPRVRGVAMNPVDHPMGGGEGRTSGGGHPVSPWGQLSKGFPTRKRKKQSNKMILTRRTGKKLKR